MFTINFEKGFRISFWVNVVLLILTIVLTISLVTKGKETLDSANLGLNDLQIEEANIEFYPTRYAYSITVDDSVDKLTLTNVPAQGDAVIEINGNENLGVGYNQVTIVVKSKDSNPVIYYIDVDKIG